MAGHNFAYIKLYEKIREEITRGAYKYGDKLPSKRVLAEETGTSVITVQHTYDILAGEGYIEARERRGYFVIFNDKDTFAVPRRESSKHVFHTSTVSEDFPFSVFSKTVRRVLANYGEMLLEKSAPFGIFELKRRFQTILQEAVIFLHRLKTS